MNDWFNHTSILSFHYSLQYSNLFLISGSLRLLHPFAKTHHPYTPKFINVIANVTKQSV
jgi:hypothetical protein